MQDAPILRVSAKNKTGLEDLIAALDQSLEKEPARLDLNRPRLPIDRVFSMSGFGTVVTGTLSDGHISIGDEVEILPSGHKGRIRGLQTHKKKEEVSIPGSRTAVNITGISTEEIQRGDVVVHPGDYRSTTRMDVSARVLRDASRPLRHNTMIKLYIGTTEVLARVRLLGVEELKPGESGWLQLEMAHPVVAVRGDRLIIRQPSPGETLGGGKVVDPHPKGRHKRFNTGIINRLEALSEDGERWVRMGSWLRQILPKHMDVQAKLADMEANGISITTISINDPGPEWFGKDGPAVARVANDFIAGVVAAHPKRFVGLCVLPLQDMKASMDELERCVRKLGMKGILLYTNLAGRFADEPEFRPLFARAVEFDIPILLHPAKPITSDIVKD